LSVLFLNGWYRETYATLYI